MTLWLDIKDFEGYYQISNNGDVRSVERQVNANKNGGIKILKSITIKQTIANHGYYVVNLRKHGLNKVITVHRLVATHFIDNNEKKVTVNHIDGDKTNNHVTNLEWATYGENNIHALKNQLRKPRGRKVLQYDINLNLICSYISVTEASRETNIGRCTISNCLNERTSFAGGFIWIYNDEI